MDGHSPTIKFRNEVLSFGAEACLPVNLSDGWIDYLAEELDSLETNGESESKQLDIECSLLAVVTILHTQNGDGRMYSLSIDKLFSKLIDFRVELGLEIVSRRTEIKCEPATLDNILKNRNVNYRLTE